MAESEGATNKASEQAEEVQDQKAPKHGKDKSAAPALKAKLSEEARAKKEQRLAEEMKKLTAKRNAAIARAKAIVAA